MEGHIRPSPISLNNGLYMNQLWRLWIAPAAYELLRPVFGLDEPDGYGSGGYGGPAFSTALAPAYDLEQFRLLPSQMACIRSPIFIKVGLPVNLSNHCPRPFRMPVFFSVLMTMCLMHSSASNDKVGTVAPRLKYGSPHTGV